jgi:hypothetical protein
MAEISNRAVATAAAGAMLAVGLAFVSPSDGSHKTDYDERVRCGGKTIRNVQIQNFSAEAVVFTKVKEYPQGTLPTTYGCLLRRGARVVRLDRPTADQVLDPALAGRFVGFKRVLRGYSGSGRSIPVVYDLRTGEVHHQLSAIEDDEPAQVQALVLKRNGSIAWLGLGESGRQEVWRLNNGKSGVPIDRLDTGPPEIPVLSFRLSADRRTLRWLRDDPGTPGNTRDDTVRTAPIH